MSNMGTSKQTGYQNQTTQIAGMTPEEKQLSDRLSALGFNQASAIETAMQLSREPHSVNTVALNAQDQANLDRAYSGAELGLRRFGNIMGQDLAGTRGLNTSDTPVSEAVLRETLPQMANLQSSKAQYGLNLGLNLANLNEGARQFDLSSLLSGATAMPSSIGFNLNKMGNERIAGAGRSGNFAGWNSDSILSQMNQGAQFRQTMHAGTNQATQAGGNAMGMASMFSDVNLKRDIKPFSWKWNGGDEKEYLGVIAQDVERSHPHLVSRSSEGALMVNYGAMTAMLLDEREQLYHELGQLREQVAAIAIAG